MQPGIAEMIERGRAMLGLFDIDGYQEAVFLFREAVQVDPVCAEAYAGLSEAYSLWAFRREIIGQESDSLYSMAMQFAEAAIKLAPNLADAHRAMAVALRRGPHADAARRKDEIQIALRINPKDADSLYEFWRIRGYDPDDPVIAQALTLKPNLCGLRIDLGVVFCQRGQLDDAERELKEALRINPENTLANYDLAMVLSEDGRRKEALALLSRVQKQHPGDSLTQAGFSYLGEPPS